jgi:hypothetical protein
LPAASRYGATTPNLVSWFDKHNEGRSYSEQVRPSNFMLAYQISPVAIHDCPEFLASIAGSDSARPIPIKLPKPVAPFDRNPARAADACFDRDTGIPVPIKVLKTYKYSVAQYHLRPEHKFSNGNYAECGPTKRRHVQPIAVRHLGKESTRWEEKFYVGNEGGAEIDYGSGPQDSKEFLDRLRAEIVTVGQRELSRRTGISRRTISRLLEGEKVRLEIKIKLNNATRKCR